MFEIINRKIEDFEYEFNRYYCVSIDKSQKKAYIEELFFCNNIAKYSIFNNGKNIYYEWKDFNKQKKYSINHLSMEMLQEDYLTIENKNTLYNLPSLFYNENVLKNIFKIHYIIPTTYNETKAFKIVTASEEIIIDANTFLPVHIIKKNYNSNNNLENCIEYNYEFEVGTVTDEDVALPDLSEYKIIE